MKQGCSEHWLPSQDPAAAAHGLQEGGFPELPVRLSLVAGWGWRGDKGSREAKAFLPAHGQVGKTFPTGASAFFAGWGHCIRRDCLAKTAIVALNSIGFEAPKPSAYKLQL